MDAFVHAVATAVALTNYPISFVYLDYCHQLRVRHLLFFQAKTAPGHKCRLYSIGSGRLQVDCAEWFAGDMLGQIALAPDFFRFPYSPQAAQFIALPMGPFSLRRGAALCPDLRHTAGRRDSWPMPSCWPRLERTVAVVAGGLLATCSGSRSPDSGLFGYRCRQLSRAFAATARCPFPHPQPLVDLDRKRDRGPRHPCSSGEASRRCRDFPVGFRRNAEAAQARP